MRACAAASRVPASWGTRNTRSLNAKWAAPAKVDRVAGSSQVAPEPGQVRLVPEPGVGGEEHERLLEAGDGDLAEEQAVHVEAGIDPAVDEHRRRRCGASERVAEHPDVVEVEHSGERACSSTSVETRQRVEHVPGVGGLAPTLPLETVWPSGKETMPASCGWSIAATTYPWLARS